MSEFGAYGIATSPQSVGTRLEGLLEEIRVRGYGALPAVLDEAEVARLNGTMDVVYANQCAAVGGEDALVRINDADIARCLLAYDEHFMRLATHPTMREVAGALLGQNIVLLMQNGVISRPDRGQFQAKWHRDLNYQHWVSSRCFSLSVLVTLEDFTPMTGGTLFLAGSHRFENLPSQSFVEAHEEAPTLPAGSMIFFDSMTFHRAGRNTSDRIRRAVNHVIGAPMLAQQIDIPAMLGAAPPDDAQLAGYLGYRWNPARGVDDWRLRKIAQMEGLTERSA